MRRSGGAARFSNHSPAQQDDFRAIKNVSVRVGRITSILILVVGVVRSLIGFVL